MKQTDRTAGVSGIILFAKQPGYTSFSSLFTIKHALHTRKVGHTGTLDCFAQGLLVVCAGTLTRLVPYITAFDKEYEAVIRFGTETDTLDPTGSVIQTAALPSFAALAQAVASCTGPQLQRPPAYSAIHIGGKRAGDLARAGKPADIPARPITVFSAEILETKEADSGGVSYARIRFAVSKGTYIRSLARDIAAAAGSCAHLAGLIRTRVGSFKLPDAAGAGLLAPFTIDSVCSALQAAAALKAADPESAPVHDPVIEQELHRQVLAGMVQCTPAFARECGFVPLVLRNACAEDFFHGRPLSPAQFENTGTDGVSGAVASLPAGTRYAVFLSDGSFAGMLEKNGTRLAYGFVVPRSV